jgi:hypothetical protein
MQSVGWVVTQQLLIGQSWVKTQPTKLRLLAA